MFTINQFIDILSSIAGAHQQLKTFGAGEPSETGVSAEIKYPLLWVQTKAGNTGYKQLGLEFNLTCADQIFEDKSNELEVISDTLQILLDILAQLNDPAWSDDFVLEPDAVLKPFTDSFDDDTAGWVATIRLRINYLSDRCVVPSSLASEEILPLCRPVHVKNSDGTYSANFDSGSVAILPDITFTDTDGTVLSMPSVKNIAAKSVADLSDQFLQDHLSISSRNALNSIYTLNTGQTTIYAAGDDGDLNHGRLADFFTLPTQNIFGNTHRFTDENGEQYYPSDYVIDHATGLGWYTVLQSAANWATAMSATLSLHVGNDTFSDFFLPNVNEVLSITSWSQVCLNYAPFNLNIGSSVQIWTSTTNFSNTVAAIRISLQTYPGASSGIKAGNQPYILSRIHFTI